MAHDDAWLADWIAIVVELDCDGGHTTIRAASSDDDRRVSSIAYRHRRGSVARRILKTADPYQTSVDDPAGLLSATR